MSSKKIVHSLLLAAVFASVSLFLGCSSNNQYDDGKMRKDMTAAEYAEEMGLGINLGNTLEAYWADPENKYSGSMIIGENTAANYETCWGAVITTQEAITGMKNAGFDTVRIPVYWGNAMESNGEFVIAEQILDRVEEVINYCRNADLYAVINIHHYDEFIVKNYGMDEALQITQKLWTQIAERYRDYSDYLVFEGFNENLGTVRDGDMLTEAETFEYVNRMNQAFVDAVRATGGNNAERLLIASGYWTNIDKTTDPRFILPEDPATDRMMVSVHYPDNAMYWANSIGNQRWLDYTKAQCELLKESFTDRGIPVFLGECTSIYQADHMVADALYTDSTACLEQMYEMMLDYDFVPVLWDVNDNFYSRTECRIKSDSDKALIETLSARLKAA